MKYLILLIDSLSYNAITEKRTPSLFQLFKNGKFKKVNTLLGYSSAIVPTIFSGKYPSEHDIWAVYKMSPETSPFRIPKVIPKSLVDKNMLLRYAVNRILFNSSKKKGLIPDTLSLVNVPLQLLNYFDISMKKHIYDSGAINGFTSIFDLMRKNKISFKYVGYPKVTDSKKIFKLAEKYLHEFTVVYAYIDELDHNGHVFGLNSTKFLSKLKFFDKLCADFLKTIMDENEEISIIAFSDHGMQDVNGTVNVQQALKSTDLEIGKDYIPYIDSTIARFWTFNEKSRDILIKALENTNDGHVLTQDEMEKYKLNFKSNKYGDLFYLSDIGKLIFPNFFTVLNNRMPKAMHGWNPEHSSQISFLYTNSSAKNIDKVNDVSKIFNFLREIMGI